MSQNNTLRVKEAAKMLGVAVRTVQLWVLAGYFPGAFKLNPMVKNSPLRIPRVDVEEFIKLQRST